MQPWRSTSTVIEWFKAIKNKAKCRFIKIVIAEFYPSISIELLDRSISFAKSLIDIESNIINTINYQENLYHLVIVVLGLKKDANHLFDVTMGIFDGAEVYKLFGLYLLNKIKPLFPVGPFTSNGRLLNAHIGPVDVQKGRSMDV